MIRAKQLGAFSHCTKTFILSGSTTKNADGAPACSDDECNKSGRRTQIADNIHDPNKSVMVSRHIIRTGSSKSKGAFEAVLPPHASFRVQDSNYKRIDKHEITHPRKNHALLSKISFDKQAKSSVSTVGLSMTADQDIQARDYDNLLQTQSITAENFSFTSGAKSSGGKNHRNTNVSLMRPTSSASSGTSGSCSSLDLNASNFEAKPDVLEGGVSVPTMIPVEPESERTENSKTSGNGQNHAHPITLNGGRRAIELYCHTLRQLKWGTVTDETLDQISYKLNPFQANQVLKLLDDYTVALSFFNWLKKQSGFKHDNHTYTTMVGILGRARQFNTIKKLLDEMASSGCKPNVVTYNRLIHGYGQANYRDEALNVFYQMQEACCAPDRVTYSTLIDIHAKAGYLDEAVDLYRNMKLAGLSPDTFTYSVMINCLGKAGHLPLADKLFNEMVRQGCAPNLVTYNSMISLHAKARNHPSALRVYKSMRSAGFRPDKITYCIMMEVLGHCGHIAEAEALFKEMKHEFVPDKPVYGLLVDMWGKAGDADKARGWYQSMLDAGLRPNVPTCNSLLSAFLRRCRFSEAREILTSMMELGLEPSLQTFTLLLSCCLETKSHMTHCHEMMAITGHPAHAFLLSLPVAEPGGQNVRSHTCSFLDSIFGEDRESKRGIVDSVVDFLHKTGFKEEAGSVWEVAADRNVYPDMVSQKRSNYWVVNLHVMSNGTAIVALSRTMASFRKLILASGVGPKRIDIVTGWGRRSRVTGASLVRQSVGELLHLFRFPFISEKGNSGCFVGCGEALERWLLNSYVERMHLL